MIYNLPHAEPSIEKIELEIERFLVNPKETMLSFTYQAFNGHTPFSVALEKQQDRGIIINIVDGLQVGQQLKVSHNDQLSTRIKEMTINHCMIAWENRKGADQ